MAHQVNAAWGAGPSARYEQLAERFRPLFANLREGAISRELERRLPVEELQLLKASGFTALRVPKEYGGTGVTLPELTNLLIELGEADSNLVQALRGHLGFTENLLNSGDEERRKVWFERLVRGETVGPATGEVGDTAQSHLNSRLYLDGEQWRIDGNKFYTTGCLYSDWIDVAVSDHDDKRVFVTVHRDAEGVEVVDDWNGFGQRLTASGTTHVRGVAVDPRNIVSVDDKFQYSPALYQIVHLANLAGIGRALSGEVAAAVAKRTRSFSNGNATRVAQDPQVLQVVGSLRAAAYSAGAIVLKTAEALERAYQARLSGDSQVLKQAVNIAELEIAQSQTIVSDLILDASTRMFDALSASATLRPLGLDRFWRNARTLTSHNPRIYKDRIVGDFAVNGTPPPAQWKIGVA
ncbi:MULTISPECIES: acyl-CoA dehydrogenase family protein [unclassified Pseudomonas]|uniref:acyl-CoA dehydrogenase family protein n=1 Tax=unclassified Pseudomonas TaxID=196821 RepID=UPI0025DD2315|nr:MULTISPECIES: acyl-CoA dehydrogenase family protein [unclassified Pseudomonas]